MNFLQKYGGVIALVAIVIAIGGYFFPQVQSAVYGTIGGPTNYYAVGATNLKIGSSCDSEFKYATTGCLGSLVQRINEGTCYIQPYATTIAASSTAYVDCQATAAVGNTTGANDVALLGVTTGDHVVADLATSTASTVFGGLDVTGVSASTTPGYIQLLLSNQTGTTFTWPTTGTASGTASYIDLGP